jgi:hypothetical protein
MSDHPFDKIDLLSYVTKSCDPARSDEIRRHLTSCSRCGDYCAIMEKEQADFAAELLFDTVIRETRPRSNIVRFPAVARYYAIAATLVLCVGAGYRYMTGVNRVSDYRIKGETGLDVYVQNSRGRIEHRDNATFLTGERIQFLYSCGKENRFILMSVDTAGSITTYFPGIGDSSMTLESGQELPLPNSIVLDDYIGREVFLGVFSKKTLAVTDVKQRIAHTFAASHSIDSVTGTGSGMTTIRYTCTIIGREP